MINLKDCDKEPIHIPGLIQSHGMLFVLSEEGLNIEQVSDNVMQFLGLDPALILQKSFLELFQESLTEKEIKEIFYTQKMTKQLSFLNNKDFKVVRLEIIVHKFDDCLIAELDPMEKEHFDLHEVFNGVGMAISEMQKTKDLVDLCQKATEEVSRLTGYDRVMLYRFDEDWNGTVIAEKLNHEDIDTYMGHRFPSSDIPKQAREMLAMNWLRSIPDVNFVPSKIVPTINPRTKRPLNLGKSIFRSPSPVHLEYLRNMHVGGTLTISIISENKLWGLIACHHEKSKPIKHSERVACQFIGQFISGMISSREVFEDFDYSEKIEATYQRILANMHDSANFVEGLMKESDVLLGLTSSTGAAVALFIEGEWIVKGKAPSIPQINDLVEWLIDEHKHDEVFSTDSLPSIYPPAHEFKDIASGILALSIPKEARNFVIWFRPEVIQTVTWAGDPQKSVEMEKGSLVLHPRKSFEAWKQQLRLRSEPWKPCEIEGARKLRRAIIELDLRRQFRRFRDLTDSVDQFIWTANSQGKIEYYNKRWYEITGLDHETRDGEARKVILHPDDLDRINAAWAHSVQSGEPYYSELRIKNVDGDYNWYLSKAVPVKDKTGKVIKWYGSATNIQRQKESENALKENIQSRDDFISIASHELKTPITALKIQLQISQKILKKDPANVPVEKLSNDIDRSLNQVKKLESLIDDFLNVTKIRSGQMEYSFAKADLRELILEALDKFQGQSVVREALQKFSAESVEVVCDKFRIEQVITNLVSNAVKYGDNKPIEIGLHNEKSHAVICVKDSGKGIAKEHQSIIFDRFERVDKHEGISGLGLGLYICKQIVDAHNGHISVESVPGHGSLFKLMLPK